MNKVIKQILDQTNLNYEHGFENIIFERERLIDVLQSGKHIKKDDRAKLKFALNLLQFIYEIK